MLRFRSNINALRPWFHSIMDDAGCEWYVRLADGAPCRVASTRLSAAEHESAVLWRLVTMILHLDIHRRT